jgi:transposase
MALYKAYDYNQTPLIPVSLEPKLLQGTFEPALHVLGENKMDLSIFDCRYKNDETGCPAYDPTILVNVVLFAYSHGFVGSRRIEWLCGNHVTCMALACMQCLDHSSIAAVVSSMQKEILSLFWDMLLVCEEQQLLGGTVFALDGLKLPSKASKAWSGTIEELQHKQEKLEAKIAQFLAEHQQVDVEDQAGSSLAVTSPDTGDEGALQSAPETPPAPVHSEDSQMTGSARADTPTPGEAVQPKAASSEASKRESVKTAPSNQTPRRTRRNQKTHPQHRKPKKSKKQKQAERLKRWRRHAQRLKIWLANHDKKIGQRGTEIKSHVSDNDSAKMATSHGVIQGFNAQALVDDKHQIIVVAEAFGDGQDAQNLTRIMPRAKTVMKALGRGKTGFRDTT